jgi:hypothetical protein
MISSEVQRTLVKSLPELWAELSDPEALARHLGELGEIRITRVEPDRMVEWEAPNTSGKVLVKPSAWGTRVTLTVNREMTAEEPVHTSAPAAESETATAPPQAGQEAPAEPDHTAAEPMPAQAQAEELPPVESESIWHELQSPRQASPEPAFQEELQAQADSGVEVEPDPDGETQVFARIVLPEPEPELDLEIELDLEPPQPLEPASRRGFFARLFRRGRKPSVEAPIALDRLATPPAPVDPTPEPVEPPVEAFDEEPSTEGAPQPWQTFPPVPPVSEPPQAPAPETTSELHAEQPAGETAAPDSMEPEDRQVEPEDGQAQGSDISAELEAAEESAAAEVTAVLTSVLDRLGSAHHRPFSRA